MWCNGHVTGLGCVVLACFFIWAVCTVPAGSNLSSLALDDQGWFLLNWLGWDNLSVRRAKQKANLMYKCINNLAPAYLCNLFAPRTPNYYFRNAKKKLMLPKPRTDYLKRSFSYSGALLWNNLPEEIRTSNSLGFFKRSSHRWFSDQYSHTANM